MIRKYLLPVLAIAGLAFAIWTAVQGAKTQPPARPVSDPPRSPFPKKISGSGIVEAIPAIFPLVPMFPELWPGSLSRWGKE